MSDTCSFHKKAPHCKNGRFYNNEQEKRHSFFMPSFTMLVECYWNSLQKKNINTDTWVKRSLPIESSEELSLTWIGHSTFLIQVKGITILTDPVFGHLPLFRRQLPAGMSPDQMPPIDYILISHNHRDHLDAASLNHFKNYEHTHFLVPKGDKAWFIKRGFKNVSEFTWWEQELITRHGFSLSFTFLPALHWSQRGIFDFNKSLWGSWMIKVDDLHVYFAGDTAYSDHFANIAKEFKDISLALMPIGPCEPRQWMSYAHVSAEEAGQAFIDLNARHFIPMHWGTFSFGTDPHQGPVERITAWWHKQELLTNKKLTILKVGERIQHTDERDQTIIMPTAEQISELG